MNVQNSSSHEGMQRLSSTWCGKGERLSLLLTDRLSIAPLSPRCRAPPAPCSGASPEQTVPGGAGPSNSAVVRWGLLVPPEAQGRCSEQQNRA